MASFELGAACCWGRGRELKEGGLGQLPTHLCPLQELEDLQKKPPPYLRNLSSDDANVLVWHALLLPVSIHGDHGFGLGPT